jgi:hypothetical protein
VLQVRHQLGIVQLLDREIADPRHTAKATRFTTKLREPR